MYPPRRRASRGITQPRFLPFRPSACLAFLLRNQPYMAQLAPLPGLLLAKLCNKKNDTPPDPHPFRITKRPVSAFNTACFAPVNGLFQNAKRSKPATY